MKRLFIILSAISVLFSGCENTDEEYIRMFENEFYVDETVQTVTDNILETGCVTTLSQITEYAKIIFESFYDDFDDNTLLSIESDDANGLWNVTTLEENSKYLNVNKSNCKVVGIGEGEPILHMNNIINNDETASKISEAILKFVYGKEILNNSSIIVEKYDSELNLWYVKSKLNEDKVRVGGSGYIILNGYDCEVQQIWHTQ